MTTKNEYTKWEYNKEHGLIFADGIAVVCVSDLPDGEATAKLICTLVNAAQEIGEPMKVAENLKAMYDALKDCLTSMQSAKRLNTGEHLDGAISVAKSVLSAIEKGD
jgi:hypothetical protein